MGKTRTKLIDDSVPESQVSRVKSQEKKTSKKREEDSLVAKLREELGIEESSGGRLPPNAASSRPGEAGRTRGEAKGEPQGVSAEGVVSEQESGAADRSQPQPSERSKKVQKPGKAKPRSKKYQAVAKDLDRSRYYPLPEALDLVKKVSYAKFNDGSGTLEVHINTAQTGVRGLVSLPFAAGRKIRILAFPSHKLGTSGKGAPEIEGVVFGEDSTLEAIEKGKIDFDILITTPEWMPKLAKVAKILGPRGLMPNPKNGTITSGEAGLKKALEGFQAGKTEYKTESKAPIVHLGLGKLNQPNEELEANVKILLQTIGKTRVKKVTLSPTMGPGVKVDLASI